MVSKMNIRSMQIGDSEAVLSIYSEGIEDLIATFETRCPDWNEWDKSHITACRLVAEEGGVIIGWGALSAVSQRECYRGVAEVSIYVARVARGKGVGTAMLNALIHASERADYWTLQSSTFEDNVFSLQLQKKCGFRIVGTRERIAMLDGHWKTTVIMERRTQAVGY